MLLHHRAAKSGSQLGESSSWCEAEDLSPGLQRCETSFFRVHMKKVCWNLRLKRKIRLEELNRDIKHEKVCHVTSWCKDWFSKTSINPTFSQGCILWSLWVCFLKKWSQQKSVFYYYYVKDFVIFNFTLSLVPTEFSK